DTPARAATSLMVAGFTAAPRRPNLGLSPECSRRLPFLSRTIPAALAAIRRSACNRLHGTARPSRASLYAAPSGRLAESVVDGAVLSTRGAAARERPGAAVDKGVVLPRHGGDGDRFVVPVDAVEAGRRASLPVRQRPASDRIGALIPCLQRQGEGLVR